MDHLPQPRGIGGVLVLALGTLAACSQPLLARGEPLKWQEYVSKTGRFSALFPGEPKTSRHTSARVETFVFSVEPRKDVVFRVSYTTLRPRTTPDMALKSYVEGRKGKVLSEKKVRLNDDFPGKEAMIELPDGGRARIRIFVTRKREYHILVEGQAAFVRSRDASKFLLSLYASDE